MLLFILSGCKFDMELWVKKSGAGHGDLSVSDVPMMTKSGLEADLEKYGIKVLSITEKESGNFKAKIKWSDFNRAFESRKVNKDGSIFLNFGEAELGSITVHVDGKIDKKRTRGYVKSSNTVVFSSGKATLVYKPRLSFPFFILWIVIIGIVIVVVSSLLAKNKLIKPKLRQIVSQEGESKTIYCSQCGAKITGNVSFCSQCGHPLK